jgi:hypothetical protein
MGKRFSAAYQSLMGIIYFLQIFVAPKYMIHVLYLVKTTGRRSSSIIALHDAAT